MTQNNTKNQLTPPPLHKFAAGCVGGFAQVFIGQPFDIVKVRLQVQTPENKLYDSMMDCVVKIWRNEGITAFYKGTLPPLLGVGGCVATRFGVFETMKGFFQKQQGGKKDLDLKYIMASGSVAGFANSLIAAPAEHLRIRMQIQRHQVQLSGLNGVTSVRNGGSLDLARQIFQDHGIRGIYKGSAFTWGREFFIGTYFVTYEAIVRSWMKPGQDRSDLSAGKLMTAGAISGFAYWVPGFPFDVLKSKMQTDNLSSPSYRSLFDCVRQTYQKTGVAGFFKGMMPCMLRAGPVNSGCFLAYETTLQHLNKLNKNRH